MSLICRICGRQFERIPPDAIRIGRGSVCPLYKFPNGEIHAIGSNKLGRKNAAKPAKEQYE